MYLVGFPLLLIPFAIYNIIALLMPGISWAEAVTRVRLPSGGEWTMSLGDMLVAFSIFLLLVEVIKAYRHGGRYLVDHGLSILLLLAMAAEFYLFPRAATATFFLMMVASFADVVGGLVAMRRRRVPVHVPAQDEIPAENTAENDVATDAPAVAEQSAPTEKRVVLKSPHAFGVRRDPPPQKVEPSVADFSAVKEEPVTVAEPAAEVAATVGEDVAPKAASVSDAQSSASHETLSQPAAADVTVAKTITSEHADAVVETDKPSDDKASENKPSDEKRWH